MIEVGLRARIAIVAPAFTPGADSRAERFAFDYTTHLALDGFDVQVLTTCARTSDPEDGGNYFRSGLDNSEPFPIFRFRSEVGDRARYRENLVQFERGEAADEEVLACERLRSPQLVAHIRSVAERYDAFVFIGATPTTTLEAISFVSDRAAVVPLLEDDPLLRLAVVGAAMRTACALLFTTEAEATFGTDVFGPSIRPISRIIGIGVDTVPRAELPVPRVVAERGGRAYIARIATSPRLRDERIIDIAELPFTERRAVIAGANALEVDVGRGAFVPELFEAWLYDRPVIVRADAAGVASLVRDTAAGWLVADADSRDAALAAALAAPESSVRERARGGQAFVASQLGWRNVTRATADAIDSFGAIDERRSRETALAQLAYLFPLARRQQRTIAAMRVSRFWRLRNLWFALKRRLRIGPAEDPVADDLDRDLIANVGDPYFLFRERNRLRAADIDRITDAAAVLPRKPTFGLIVEGRGRSLEALEATVRSITAQIYVPWVAHLIVDEGAAERAAAFASLDSRIAVSVDVPAADYIGGLWAGDLLEAHALFEFALRLNRDETLDAIYSDEDALDQKGEPTSPFFKPDWSPESLLGRDVVGGLLLARRELVEAVGGIRPVHESATWFELALRLSERTQRVGHIAQVLYHRHALSVQAPADLAIAVEVALRRRQETATVRATDWGVHVRFTLSSTPRVTIIIPTRDRADLLEGCLSSIFATTSYPAFDVIVVDNGSREEKTAALLARYAEREQGRFRVLRDDGVFNYPRLNNAAVEIANEIVVLLNNDTTVISPDWIEAMVQYAQRPEIGAVGARLLYSDDTVQHAGVVLGILGLAGHAHRFFPANARGYHGALAASANYLAVTGACLMIERAKYQAVGGLDEAFAVSYNDVDFCLRLHAAGYRNVYAADAKLYHFESKSRGVDDTPIKVARAMREVGLMRERWPHLAVHDPYYNPNLTVDAEDFSVRV